MWSPVSAAAVPGLELPSHCFDRSLYYFRVRFSCQVDERNDTGLAAIQGTQHQVTTNVSSNSDRSQASQVVHQGTESSTAVSQGTETNKGALSSVVVSQGTESSVSSIANTSSLVPCICGAATGKRKISRDDVTRLEYEVLVERKKKMIEERTYYELMNKKLRQELEDKNK